MGLVIDLACEEVNFFSQGSIELEWGGGGGVTPNFSVSPLPNICVLCAECYY